jgi:hypothetical protein
MDLHALISIAFKFERSGEMFLRQWELTAALTFRSGVELTGTFGSMVRNLRQAEAKFLKLLDWRVPRTTIASLFDEWLDARHLTGSEEAGRAARALDRAAYDPRVFTIPPDVLFDDFLREARGIL